MIERLVSDREPGGNHGPQIGWRGEQWEDI
jgi:hypothetical protein